MVLLIILDGFGIGKNYEGNAYYLAKKPFFEMLFKNYPWTLLKASGHAVGIPEGNQGGSEVGHFTIGSGRITFQTLEEINHAIKDGTFFKKKELLDAAAYLKNKNSSLHLLGMISDKGVHADIRHLFALLEFAKQNDIKKVYIHAIADGRDTSERSADIYIKQIQQKISNAGIGVLADLIGRYYAMDRDNNWNRTEKAYDLYTLGAGIEEKNPLIAVKNAYDRQKEESAGTSSPKTDYYIDPIVFDKNGVIKDEDVVIFWNFRTDRARQLTWAFTKEHQIGFAPKKSVRPYFICFGPYSDKATVIFHTPVIKNNLSEIISKLGLSQLRIAETEKYAHVTYFFNSQIEKPYKGEDRILIDSPKCPSYAQKPEMSAYEIKDKVIPEIEKESYGLIVLNFANCDLVGHSGELPAAIKAVETVDKCLSEIIPEAQSHDYDILVIGDHGNIEYMIYDEGALSGSPCPSHTTNPVPMVLISKKFKNLQKNHFELKDIAPTILKMLGIEKPKEMTGEALI